MLQATEIHYKETPIRFVRLWTSRTHNSGALDRLSTSLALGMAALESSTANRSTLNCAMLKKSTVNWSMVCLSTVYLLFDGEAVLGELVNSLLFDSEVVHGELVDGLLFDNEMVHGDGVDQGTIQHSWTTFLSMNLVMKY